MIIDFGVHWTGGLLDIASDIFVLVLAYEGGGESAAFGHTHSDFHYSAHIGLFWSIQRLQSIRRHQGGNNNRPWRPLY